MARMIIKGLSSSMLLYIAYGSYLPAERSCTRVKKKKKGVQKTPQKNLPS